MKTLLQISLCLFLWLSQDFFYFSDAMKFMNALPQSQREKAYISPIPSARAGAINGYYTVIYPDA